MKTKAAVLWEAEAPLEVEEVDLDEPGSNEVLVELVATGVCHTDLHAALGHFPVPKPMVLGHEGAGIVREVGPGVLTVVPGDHVALVSMPSCGHCDRCVSGEPYICERGFEGMGSGALLSGETRLRKGKQRIHHLFGQASFAQYAVVHESTAVKVPHDVPLHIAGPLGCGFTTGIGAVLNTAGVRPGETVAVFGCGGVGLSAVMGAALANAAEIVAIDILDHKLDMARDLGATRLINATQEDPVEAILESTGGGVDYAFECVGLPELMDQAYRAVRAGGKAIVCGAAPSGSQLSIEPLPLLQGKSIVGSAAGSTCFAVDIPRLLRLYQSGRLPLDRLITGTYPLEDINLALEALKKGQAVKSVITFGKG